MSALMLSTFDFIHNNIRLTSGCWIMGTRGASGFLNSMREEPWSRSLVYCNAWR
jgi:hypothetical protein